MSLASAENATIIVQEGDKNIQIVQTPMEVYLTFNRAGNQTAEVVCKDASQAVEVWETLRNPKDTPVEIDLKKDKFIIKKVGGDRVELIYMIDGKEDEARIFHFPFSAIKKPLS